MCVVRRFALYKTYIRWSALRGAKKEGRKETNLRRKREKERERGEKVAR